MWQLRHAQLAENGIILDPADIPVAPGIEEPYETEWDMDQVERVYLGGGGGFWLARHGDEPVGYVGAQAMGGVAELRRMYVKQEHRRQGIGTQLVRALIARCSTNGIRAVELWTPENEEGHSFYETLGFEKVDKPLLGFAAVEQATRRGPNPQEIRMRLVLTEKTA